MTWNVFFSEKKILYLFKFWLIEWLSMIYPWNSAKYGNYRIRPMAWLSTSHGWRSISVQPGNTLLLLSTKWLESNRKLEIVTEGGQIFMTSTEKITPYWLGLRYVLHTRFWDIHFQWFYLPAHKIQVYSIFSKGELQSINHLGFEGRKFTRNFFSSFFR